MTRGKVSSWATRSGNARTRVAFLGSTGSLISGPTGMNENGTPYTSAYSGRKRSVSASVT